MSQKGFPWNIINSIKQGNIKTISSLILLAGLLYIGSQSFFYVRQGHCGIKFSKLVGLIHWKLYRPGIHIKIPFIQYAFIYNLKPRIKQYDIVLNKNDMQKIKITIEITFHLQDKQLHNIHINFGPYYDRLVLPSLANESLKQIYNQNLNKINNNQDFFNQNNFRQKMKKLLYEKGHKFNIQIDDLVIKSLQNI